MFPITNGRIDATCLVVASQRRECPPRARDLHRAVAKEFEVLQAIPLVDFFLWMATKRGLVCFYQQLVWSVGLLLDKSLGRCVVGGQVRHLQVADIDGGGDSALHKQNEDNAKYWQACAAHVHAAGMSFMSLATDKSRVRSLGLQNSCFATPDGVAWWGVTQDLEAKHRAHNYR